MYQNRRDIQSEMIYCVYEMVYYGQTNSSDLLKRLKNKM